jgi:hypothetical protein
VVERTIGTDLHIHTAPRLLQQHDNNFRENLKSHLKEQQLILQRLDAIKAPEIDLKLFNGAV